ncbi:MAG: hypothetical protein ACPIOQ_48795, partial [Promethearchaeia archaeon]
MRVRCKPVQNVRGDQGAEEVATLTSSELKLFDPPELRACLLRAEVTQVGAHAAGHQQHQRAIPHVSAGGPGGDLAYDNRFYNNGKVQV